MQTRVARALIERGVLRQGTEFQAYCGAAGLAGHNTATVLSRFVLRAAGQRHEDGVVVLEGINQETGEVARFRSEAVITVDGMPIPRLLRTYGLTEAGDVIPEGRRRGRRRKSDILRAAQEAEAAAAATAAAETG